MMSAIIALTRAIACGILAALTFIVITCAVDESTRQPWDEYEHML